MAYSQGLKFKKFDLHVHTPASDDYKAKNVKPDDIVNESIKKGLDGIAVTDHQTGSWVDQIKKAAKNKNLVVFPGVELKVHGGKDGVHLIVLFDVDKGTDHVAAFLNTIKVYDHQGKTNIADKTAVDVANELQQFDPNAIMILAHCDSSFGVSADMRGDQRSNIFKPEYKCLLGAEASESNFLDGDKKKKKTRIIDLFNGEHKPYHKKKLGVYQASDAHLITDIGARYSYFKVDSPVTLEDIRQSLLDRDTRIRQSFEFQAHSFPRISNLKITSGFLADQELEFHDGLNSILGAKGSGKSLVIEFLRFCLGQEPTNKEILSDHLSKLDKCLKIHGEIEVVFIDESGKKYVVKTIYSPIEGNSTTIIDSADGQEKEFQIEQIFPVLFLSQNEIIKIAEDKTGASQREFIDKFFDFRRYQQNIDNLNKELEEVDLRLVDILKARISSIDLEKKMKTYNEEIEKLGRQITNIVFEEYSKKEKIGQSLNNYQDFVESLKTSLLSTEGEYKDYKPFSTTDTEIENNPHIKRTKDAVKNILNKITGNIYDAKIYLEQEKIKITQEIKDWKIGFNQIKAKYDNLVKESGGTQVTLDQKRKKFIQNIESLKKELSRHQGKAMQAEAIVEKRNELIEKLKKAHKDYFEARKNRCEFFTKSSDGALDVTIKERVDKSSFRENLMKFKKGSWLKDEEILIISEKMDPNNFICDLLAYEWSNKTARGRLANISKVTEIKQENIERLAQHLLGNYELKEILALIYNSTPKDVPEIKYRVGNTFKKLHELSVGQKAVALLIIALSDGTFPIVIDQPEDSLDLRSIWDDVCKKIRSSKEKRQFIFTTHNSSVAVASDTDKFSIMQADADHGEVIFSGSLNRPDIKKEVIDYLEGGESTYNHKRQKYRI